MVKEIMKTPREFCYWLQGMFELSETNSLTDRQLGIIRKELNAVFTHSGGETMPTVNNFINKNINTHDGVINC